jgi:hypothetical protein
MVRRAPSLRASPRATSGYQPPKDNPPFTLIV